MCDVSPLGCDESKPSRRDALPARIADLAAEGERVLELLLRRVDVALEEVDLGSKRLRPGLEGRQASCPDILQRLVEDAPGVVELAAEQVETASIVRARAVRWADEVRPDRVAAARSSSPAAG